MSNKMSSSVMGLKYLDRQKYGIKAKPDSSGYPQEKAIIDIIHQVLVNFLHTCNPQETHVDNTDLWMVILVSEDFVIKSTCYIIKDKSTYQLVIRQDMLIPIIHVAYWKYICEHNQAKIEKEVICKKSTRNDYENEVGYQVFLKNKTVYKYKNHLNNRINVFKCGQTQPQQ